MVTGHSVAVEVPEEGVEAEAEVSAGMTALTRVANASLTDTAAVTDRESFGSIYWLLIDLCCDISKLSVNYCFSSLKAEEKRGGSGSHNWGTVKDELRSVEQRTSCVSETLMLAKTKMHLVCILKSRVQTCFFP